MPSRSPTARARSLDGQPLLGISVFAVLGIALDRPDTCGLSWSSTGSRSGGCHAAIRCRRSAIASSGNLDLKRPDGDIRICNSNIKFHNLYPFTRAPKTISLMGCWSAIAARPSGRFPCSAGLVPASRSRSARSVAPVEARAGGPDRRLRTLISGRAASAPPGCEERRASSAAPSYRVKLPVSTMWSRPGAARDSTDAREPPGTRSCWHD